MEDIDIEELILDSIINVFDTTDEDISLGGDFKSDYLTVSFDEENNKWVANDKLVDYLSCVLLYNQPHPNFVSDDSAAISTLMKLFGKSAGWIRSFQCGCRGISNSSTSITGYILGMKMVKLYEEYNAPFNKSDDNGNI